MGLPLQNEEQFLAEKSKKFYVCSKDTATFDWDSNLEDLSISKMLLCPGWRISKIVHSSLILNHQLCNGSKSPTEDGIDVNTNFFVFQLSLHAEKIDIMTG